MLLFYLNLGMFRDLEIKEIFSRQIASRNKSLGFGLLDQLLVLFSKYCLNRAFKHPKIRQIPNQIYKYKQNGNILEHHIIYYLILSKLKNIFLIFSCEYRRAFLKYIPILKRYVKDLNSKNGINQIKVKF